MSENVTSKLDAEVDRWVAEAERSASGLPRGINGAYIKLARAWRAERARAEAAELETEEIHGYRDMYSDRLSENRAEAARQRERARLAEAALRDLVNALNEAASTGMVGQPIKVEVVREAWQAASRLLLNTGQTSADVASARGALAGLLKAAEVVEGAHGGKGPAWAALRGAIRAASEAVDGSERACAETVPPRAEDEGESEVALWRKRE